MKIGIVTSGNDMLTLFKFLTKYDHEYILYYDQTHQFYGDQTFETSLLAVQEGIGYLMKEGVDFIILPPMYELALLGGKLKIENLPAGRQGGKLLPLFKEYVLKECFAYSLIGKIGIFGDYADIQVAQPILQALEKEYKLSDTQKAIKKFHLPFAYRTKEVSLWKYFLSALSFSDMMVNRIIKFDLRYFKDAMVDTLIPLNYGYFNYQNTISKFLNFKKIRFHKLEKLENCFQQLAGSLKLKAGSYAIKVCYTGHIDFLQRQKKWMRLLQRGKSVKMEMVKIEDGKVKKITNAKK